MGWWDVLKFGPPGLSALALLWTANLLRSEIQRPDAVRESARKLISSFMIFAILMTTIGLGAVFYSNTYVQRDETLSQIREQVGMLDSAIVGKLVFETQLPDPAQKMPLEQALSELSQTRAGLISATSAMCDIIAEIHSEAGGQATGDKYLPTCRRFRAQFFQKPN